MKTDSFWFFLGGPYRSIKKAKAYRTSARRRKSLMALSIKRADIGEECRGQKLNPARARVYTHIGALNNGRLLMCRCRNH